MPEITKIELTPQQIKKLTLSPEELETKKSKEKFWKDFKKDFIAGSLSGAAVTLATQPLDTLAVKAQTGITDIEYVKQPFIDRVLGRKPVIAKPPAPLQKFKNLYKGVTPRLIKSTAAGAIGYPVFMAAANKLEDRQEKRAALIPIQTTPNSAKVLPKLYHSAELAEFGRSRRMPTSDAIDYLTHSWTHRPINIGKGKDYYGPRPIVKEALWAPVVRAGASLLKAFKPTKTFFKGMTMSGTKQLGGFKGAITNPNYAAGVSTSIGVPLLAPPIKKTTLELGTINKTTRGPRSAMISPSNL